MGGNEDRARNKAGIVPALKRLAVQEEKQATRNKWTNTPIISGSNMCYDESKTG